MNYGEIKQEDIADGPGVRVSLFVSGCRNHCKGCFQPQTWAFDYGKKWDVYTMAQLLSYLDPEYIHGLTILGGDPFEPENIETVTQICKTVKRWYPSKTIWIYTGYLYEDLKDLEIMGYIDVLVDGPFIEERKDKMLQFRGSNNQRLIDIKKSTKNITLWR